MADGEARGRDDAAAAWAIRRETRGDDPAFAAELDEWLAQDPRHAGALLRAEAAVSLLNRGRALAGSEVREHGAGRRRFLIAGGAAGMAAAAIAGFMVLLPTRRRFVTGIGEVQEQPLGDGSIAAINTDTEISVSFAPRLRRVTLERGEAWFKVAKDKARPFVVEAGDVRVRAVGTAFSVRRLGGGVDVLVTEGVVEVWTRGRAGEVLRLTHGEKVTGAGAATPPRVVRAEGEIQTALAWRDGQIALYGETLGDAAAQFNRYNLRKIIIQDPDVAGEKVVGEFNATDPEGFARAAAAMVGARVAVSDQALVLYRDHAP